MWFKNLTLFRFSEAFTLSSTDLNTKLETMRFRSCGSHDESSFGWTSPLGASSEQLCYEVNGFLMFCGKKEEKVLPASVVNEMLQEKVAELETQQGDKLSKKERSRLKDELIFELLPKAFSFSRKTYFYIDVKGGWIVVDSPSSKKAEDLLSHLRRCLGSLPVVPVSTQHNPVTVMTQWLLEQTSPAGINIEDECELRSPEEEGAIVRCKNHNLSLPEIKNHLDTGKQAIKLAMNWEERLAFVLDENLAVKRLRFLDAVQDQRDDIETDDDIAAFDADFAIMSAELAQFLPQLFTLFGGEVQS